MMFPDFKHGYTDEEIAAANVLYLEDIKDLYKPDENGQVYMGDFGCGLGFVMATYSPMCWEKYFKKSPSA